MNTNYGGLVDFVEVKTICHRASECAQFSGQRIAGRAIVKNVCARKSCQSSDEPECSGERLMNERADELFAEAGLQHCVLRRKEFCIKRLDADKAPNHS